MDWKIADQQVAMKELFLSSNLKGHCHAIWQLNKKLQGVFASIEFQN